MKISRRLPRILLALFLLLLIAFPVESVTGAKAGLMLWFRVVLPTLLPFLIAARLCVSFHLADTISRISYPILKHLPGLNKSSCYPFILGQISGFPVGAMSASLLQSKGQLTIREANHLLPLCNNPSPAFILSYVAIHTLNLGNRRYLIWGILFVSAYFSSLLGPILFGSEPRKTSHTIPKDAASTPHDLHTSPPVGIFRAIDDSITSGFETITKIGGYIILFSILAYTIGSFEELPATIRVIGILILELTTGINEVKGLALAADYKIILAVAGCAFGGLSCIAQTKSVLASSGLSITYYIKCRFVGTLFAGVLAYLCILLNFF